MSNRFYSLDLLNGSNKVTLGVNNGLSSNYDLILPNTAPSDDQVLAYNSTTGLFDWRPRSSGTGSGNIVYSRTEPTNKVDGMLWFEIGAIDATTYWEWDAANGLWWSNTKTIDLPIHFSTQRTTASASENTRAVNYNPPVIRRNILLRVFYIYMINLNHSSTNFYTLTWRFINNLGIFTDIHSFTTQSWTSSTTVYRSNIDVSSFNNAGTGSNRFVDNMFSFEFRAFSDTDTSGVLRPFGTSRFVYRHERRLT